MAQTDYSINAGVGYAGQIADNRNAAIDSKSFTGGPGTATSASRTASVGPYAFAAGDTIVIDVDNAGNATATFDAAAGYVIDTTNYPVADQDTKTLKLKVDNGATQTITFSGSTTTAASIINQINAQIVGGSAEASTTHVKIKSDKLGTESAIAIVAGGTSDMTFNAAVAGTGDVASIAAVTAAEVKAVIEADTTALVTVVGGRAVISSPTTGTTSEIDIKSGNCVAKMGLTVAAVTGTNALALQVRAGRMVSRVGVNQCSCGGAAPIGIALRDVTGSTLDTDGVQLFNDTESVSVMRSGSVWVDCETTAVAGDATLYYDNVSGQIGVGGAGGQHVALTGSYINTTSTTAGGLVQLVLADQGK